MRPVKNLAIPPQPPRIHQCLQALRASPAQFYCPGLFYDSIAASTNARESLVALFKYGQSKHSDVLVKVGGFRIGTLHDFRKTEHRSGIADPAEGRKTIEHPVRDEVFVGGSARSAALADTFGLHTGPKGRIRISGIQLQRVVDSEDLFIFCLASRFSRAVLKQFDGADACVKVSRPTRFFGALTESLNARVPVEFLGFAPVHYRERSEQWNGIDIGEHPAVIKELEFAPQCEVRALWRPKERGDIEPFVVESSAVCRYCERVL